MKFVFCNLYQQSQVKWIEFPDGGVTRGGHGERDVEAAEELLKRGLNFESIYNRKVLSVTKNDHFPKRPVGWAPCQ